MRADRLDEAVALGHQAVTLARQYGEQGHEAWALRLLGEIASRRTRPDALKAEDHYREASAIATDLGMQPYRGMGMMSCVEKAQADARGVTVTLKQALLRLAPNRAQMFIS